MKHKQILYIHIAATILATATISLFLIFSIHAEIDGNHNYIRSVKQSILYTLPILIFCMPALALTGKQLAGNSTHPTVTKKLNRMKLIMINGFILIALACLLYYRSHYGAIDIIFQFVQLVEQIIGSLNLFFIGLNARNGMILSRKIRFSEVL